VDPILVIGGGIAGLACAYRLQSLGAPVLLLEKSERAGGVIQSTRRDGFLLELGPQSFSPTEPLLQFISELGLAGELTKADPSAPRYVLLHNTLARVPMNPQELLTTPTLSWISKLQLFTELLRHTRPPEPDESIGAFVRRKFSQELLENLAGPFVSGIYAGDAEKISLRAAFPSAYAWEKQYGSVLRGAMKSRGAPGKPKPTLCSFAGGMGALPERLAQRLGTNLLLSTRVLSITRVEGQPGTRFAVAVESADRRETLRASALVLAAPAYTAAALLEGCAPQTAAALRGIEYAPVAVVTGGYAREQVRHALDGFGYLIPRTERRQTLGTVWNSSLFPGRAPAGHESITSFIGGATHPEILGHTEDQLAATVEEETHAILGISGAPVLRNVKRHVHALPQYNVGHTQRIAALSRAVQQTPGLFIAGNYLEGPAISATVETALKTALHIHAWR